MKKHFGKLFAILAVIAILILGFTAGKYMEEKKHDKADLSASAISAQISELSELSTAELQYRGIVRYSEGVLNFITKKEFTMLYDANIKAGVDLSDVKIDIQENKITVSLPAAQIQNITIDPNSLEFYDEKFAIFNFQNRTDTVVALQYAEEDINKKAEKTDLLATADERAQALITSFLKSIWTDKETSPKIIFKTI